MNIGQHSCQLSVYFKHYGSKLYISPLSNPKADRQINIIIKKHFNYFRKVYFRINY